MTDLKEYLASWLNVDRTFVNLTYCKDAHNASIKGADALSQYVNSYLKQWYRPRHPRPNMLLSNVDLMNHYQSLPQFSSDIMQKTMAAFNMDELNQTINSLGRKKASGPSQIFAEPLLNMPSKWKIHLLDLLNNCILAQDIPDGWKTTNLFLIAKDPVFLGDLARTRSITLMEVPHKLLFKIINSRLSTDIALHDGLPGNNNGFSRTISTTDAASVLKSLVDCHLLDKKHLYILTSDIFKAYDSVPWQWLEQGLGRIQAPSSLINLLKNIFYGRFTRLLTPYGPNESFKPQAGIEHGDSISPLLWNIFFDSILCLLNDKSNNSL
jgi:hypothetical protein